MSDRIRLGDDGTLDTVLVCRECGQEARYTYMPEDIPADQTQEAYDAWIEWAIEDFDSGHVCDGDSE